MAQNITLLGANYPDVPAVELPKTGGGTASFTDISDTTAVAEDVSVGKYFYTASGTKIEGTAAQGTAGTPVATKGVVSDHSIAVTPSVTNIAGSISGGTIVGDPVSVTASELVSGTLSINDNGTYDVSDYASASVDVGLAMPSFTYSGSYSVLDDGNGNWRIKFLTSGTFKITKINGRTTLFDIFAVGGGGGGKSRESGSYWGHSGGGGGYTKTVTGVYLSEGTDYTVTIGAGGAVDGAGGSSSFASFISVSGGQQGWAHGTPGAGGSGGGGGSNNGKAGNGGSDGGNGGAGGGTAGAGQGTTTREFGSSSGTLYAGGGGGGTSSTTASNRGYGGSGGGGQGAYADGNSSAGATNYGGGGGGCSSKNGASAYAASKGGSGIVIIRNAR